MDSSFEQSILNTQPELKRFAFRLVKDTDMADDLVQDTLYKALNHKDKYQADTNLKAWLFTILKNTFINEYRFNKKFPQVDISVLSYTNKNEDSPESRLNEKEIIKIIHQLRPKLQEPFQMHVEGYKYEEIAEKLQIPLGSVKSRIFFARKKLMSNLIDNQSKKPILTTMNDITKQNIKDRLEKALHTEVITTFKAGMILDITGNQVSCIKNPKLWYNVGHVPWDKVLAWVNSGQTLVQYGEKHGKTVTEKKDSVPIVKGAVLKVEEFVSETIPFVSKAVDPVIPRIKIKPGVLEKRQKEIEHKRMSNGQLVDLLLEEKAVLRQKIDAIDVLLKHYIS